MAGELEDVIDDEDIETGDEENEEDDVETYLLPDSSAITDPYLREVWDSALKLLDEESDDDDDDDDDDLSEDDEEE